MFYPEIDYAREPDRARVWLLTTGQIKSYALVNEDKNWSQTMMNIVNRRDKLAYFNQRSSIWDIFTNLLLDTYPTGIDIYGRELDTPKRGDLIYLEPELKKSKVSDTGKYIFDGTLILDLGYRYTNKRERIVPREFKVPEEFPINYWLGRIQNYCFYFPFSQLFPNIDMKDIEQLPGPVFVFPFVDKKDNEYQIIGHFDNIGPGSFMYELRHSNYFKPSEVSLPGLNPENTMEIFYDS